MKLEYLPDGSPDCPLIRLYGFDLAGAVQLREIFNSIARGPRTSIPLHEQAGVEAIDGCQLHLRLGRRNLGVVEREPLIFECIATADAWSDMAALVAPFCESAEMNCYQWLNEDGEVSLLLSPDGLW